MPLGRLVAEPAAPCSLEQGVAGGIRRGGLPRAGTAGSPVAYASRRARGALSGDIAEMPTSVVCNPLE